jgi:DNA (cytosine-5)-methyltransferase 1
MMPEFRVAEFFAGIGLVRLALDQANFRTIFANDIDYRKYEMYRANFGPDGFVLGDVRGIGGASIPTVDLATASFPCTDLSLAGWRRGLDGHQSSMFWEFARVLGEMGDHRPRVVVLENVPAFATSRNGSDLRAAIAALNDLGYSCDLLVLDARHFVPQSRQRLFIVGTTLSVTSVTDWRESSVRPRWVRLLVKGNPELRFHAFPLPPLPPSDMRLSDIVERLSPSDPRWWEWPRLERFVQTMRPKHHLRVEGLRHLPGVNWATAYRRTRDGCATWEVRSDSLAGCLRTARGGSSKQALVEAGEGELRVRWLTVREYACLQGAPNFRLPEDLGRNQGLFGFGDAVCVPAVRWLAENYLRPLLLGERSPVPFNTPLPLFREVAYGV